MSCGIDWMMPAQRFEGVAEDGTVFFSQKVATLVLQKNTHLPLYITFSSSNNIKSPYLGHGWEVPLIESRITQSSENTFEMIQPDGKRATLFRSQKNPNLLVGDYGWTGEIQENNITVWATCGWTIKFTNGKISTLTTAANEKLYFQYENGIFFQLHQDSNPILTYKKDKKQGLFLTKTDRIEISSADEPIVSSVNGTKVVSSIGEGVSQITDENKKTFYFRYGIDSNRNPTIEIRDKVISWDPKTKLVLSTGNDMFNIIPSNTPRVTALITKSYANGLHEKWQRNDQKGIEFRMEKDGNERYEHVYMSGVLAGKIRLVEEKSQQGNRKSRFVYNEEGLLLRRIDIKTDINDQEKQSDFTINSTQDEVGKLTNLSIAFQ